MMTEPIVFITGVSSGIGLETALLFKKKGFQIIGSSRTPEKYQHLPFPVVPLDITSQESIDACVRYLKRDIGRVDVLVCNAGTMGPVAAGEELTSEALWQVFQTNFFGTVHLIRAVLPLMRQQDKGKIIVLSSIAGKVGAPPFFSAYTSSKHALEGYIETLAKELAPFHISVTLIEPGYCKTALSQSIQSPPHPLPEYEPRRTFTHTLQTYAIDHGRDPRQVALAILKTVQHPNPPLRVLVGLDAKFLDAGRKYLPEKIFQFLLNKMFSWRKAPPTPVTPVRRFLLNSKKADRAWRIVSTGMVVLALFQLASFIFKRKPDS
ncbi:MULTISPECIES: SDR family oxidoreductase [Anaerolinea]|uniref:SDR family oxidoreductase n=1 Tax=Anaerolinea TaxID=233189 RepID=UPI002616E1EA|nr:SDR family oxidoreductase [Anaerolinea thermophila]